MLNDMLPHTTTAKDVISRIDEPLTDSDLERHLGHDRSKYIVKYGDLDAYENVEDLLPNYNDFKIILTEHTKNVGHWTVIMRYKDKAGDIIEYFNSYGSKPSYELGFISRIKNLFLNQDEKHLNQLLNRALKSKKYKIIYNKTRFQKYSPKIQTCGRWCVLRILRMKYFADNLNDFIDFINNIKEKNEETMNRMGIPVGLRNDFIAAYLIP